MSQLDSDNPDISIIIPSFNRIGLIGSALSSILLEIGINLEIVVVDDGSTDGTESYIEELMKRDNRIRFYRSEHMGVASARNIGIQHAKGTYIGFLDSDDLNCVGRLFRQKKKLDQKENISAIIGMRDYFDHDDATAIDQPGATVRRVIDICLGSTLFRRGVFEKYGIFDAKLTFGEDLDLFFRMLEGREIFLIETETAIHYRVHKGNMTRDQLAMHRALLRAHHNSMVRRRDKNFNDRIDIFFFRRFDIETEFGGWSSVLPQDRLLKYAEIQKESQLSV